jgi:hypothetical protein
MAERTRPPLIAVQRKPHHPYPRCDARELIDDRGRYVPAPKYPWCNRRGEWNYGDQHLCRGHAWKLATERRVSGITPNGRWGGCLVHIDCVHSIDDPDWETFWTQPGLVRQRASVAL